MDLGRISQALQDYTGQQDSMESVTAVLQEELGEPLQGRPRFRCSQVL